MGSNLFQRKCGGQRNIRQGAFVYTDAAKFWAGMGWQETRKKKPRGSSRGAMTRSLSGSLTRKKRCQHPEATLPIQVCQLSLLSPLPQSWLTQSRKELTHVK